MIKSIRLTSVPESEAWSYSHAFSCPCIVDKTFFFNKGLNIVCGYNGCGKTSLLSTIRRMTFCENEMYSQIRPGTHVFLNIINLVDDGLFDKVDMVNDWDRSVFSLRPSNELSQANVDNSAFNLVQTIDSSKASSGMDTLRSLQYMFMAIKEQHFDDDEDIGNFKKMVLDVPLTSSSFGSTRKSLSTHDSDQCKKVMEYINTHRINSDRYTVILDEPDNSVDICGIDALYNTFARSDFNTKHQYIAVLHNPILVYKFYKDMLSGKDVNFIELTSGYLDNVVNFVEGKPINRPTDLYWTCKRNKED